MESPLSQDSRKIPGGGGGGGGGIVGDHNVLRSMFYTKHSVCLVVSMCIAGI